jgi:uncharacterized membrane protein
MNGGAPSPGTWLAVLVLLAVLIGVAIGFLVFNAF